MPKWEVEFYVKSNGDCPTEEFLTELSKKAKKDIVFINRALERLETLGPELRRPHADILRDHIYELRVGVFHRAYRLLYFFFDGQRIVITHGIVKKSDDVPAHEIDKAIEYRVDYYQRKHKGRQ
jgi:phage-related protein